MPGGKVVDVDATTDDTEALLTFVRQNEVRVASSALGSS
jgi:hypothetical protein